MSSLQVIQGGKDDKNRMVVCTWCAARFASKVGLKKHWQKSKRCQANKTVSSQTQGKYEEVSDEDD